MIFYCNVPKTKLINNISSHKKSHKRNFTATTCLQAAQMGAGCSTTAIEAQEKWVSDRVGLAQAALDQSFPNAYSVGQIQGKLRQEYNTQGRVSSGGRANVDDYVLNGHWGKYREIKFS